MVKDVSEVARITFLNVSFRQIQKTRYNTVKKNFVRTLFPNCLTTTQCMETGDR